MCVGTRGGGQRLTLLAACADCLCLAAGSDWLKCFDFESAVVFYAHRVTREERYVTYDPAAGCVSSRSSCPLRALVVSRDHPLCASCFDHLL